jgi:hypothetical protein
MVGAGEGSSLADASGYRGGGDDVVLCRVWVVRAGGWAVFRCLEAEGAASCRDATRPSGGRATHRWAGADGGGGEGASDMQGG